MSEQFNPLAQQASERMVSLLNDNRSIFTKPLKDNATSQFVMPVNARTGQKYTGATALILIMQNRRDPRWLSYDQARFNKTPVKKGAHGTLIEFHSTSELRQKIENGEPVLKANGKPKLERVKLDEPVKVEAWLFNGKDLTNLQELKVTPHDLSPLERAQAILVHSGVQLKTDNSQAHYDREKDIIEMPSIDQFEKPELFYAAALHELAHWTSHEDRLNRTLTDLPGSDPLLREELRANLASILISAELNLPYLLGHHENYLKDWAKLLTEEPQELFAAAADAQQIADYLTGLQLQQDQKQNTTVKEAAGKLAEGMEIDYNNTTYRILQQQSRGAFKIENIATGEKIRITPTSGLYKSLVRRLNNPGQAVEMNERQEQEQEPELTEAEEETKSYSRKR